MTKQINEDQADTLKGGHNDMSTPTDSEISTQDMDWSHTTLTKIFAEIEKGLVGQTKIAQRLLMALVAEGHVLLEGLPGLAKTTAIKILSQICHLDFRRIQFTPDLLPADITGTEIFVSETSTFKIKKGPIFSHLLLADEINRAPSKVQAALLEAMQERQVTLSGQHFQLNRPFLVLATQNPIDQEGTYQLPEAQLDRFLFKLSMSYGSLDDEIQIMQKMAGDIWEQIEPVVDKSDIEKLSSLCRKVYMSPELRRYIATIVFATRFPREYGLADLEPWISCGASPRASLALEKTAKIQALFQGRTFVTPSDVKEVSFDILNHRIVLSYDGEAEEMSKEHIIAQILGTLAVP